MTDVSVRGRSGLGLAARLAAPLFLLASAPAFAAAPIIVHVDRARLIKLPGRVATVVIGNPLIADLSIEPGGLAVITGKGYGATNVIALDRSGAVLTEKTIEVKGPTDPTVVVYRGITKQTYSCTPDCSRRNTLGDTGSDYFDGFTDKDYFAKTLGDTVNRNSQAMAAGAQSPGPGGSFDGDNGGATNAPSGSPSSGTISPSSVNPISIQRSGVVP